MPAPTKVPCDRTEVEVNPSEDKDGIVKEEPLELQGHAKVQAEVGQESFGAPPDDETQYVKGHPVIRSDKFSLRPAFAAFNSNT